MLKSVSTVTTQNEFLHLPCYLKSSLNYRILILLIRHTRMVLDVWPRKVYHYESQVNR